MTRGLTPQLICETAARVPADSPYRFGDKVLLVRVASDLDETVEALRPALLSWQRSGQLELARVDMVAGMALPGALRRSMIRERGMPDTSGWHAVIAPGSQTRNPPRFQIPPGSVVRVHDVLAGAYRGGRKDYAITLTHAYIEGDEASLCRRSPAEHACDLTHPGPPTCEVCCKRLGNCAVTDDHPDLYERKQRSPVTRDRSLPASYIEPIYAAIIASESVSGRELLDAADSLDIEIPQAARRLLERNMIRKVTLQFAWYTGRSPEGLNEVYPAVKNKLASRTLTPNASTLVWEKGEGVDRDGHNLTWWKNKHKSWSRSEHDRPRISIDVRAFDRAGQRAPGRSFPADQLTEAKAFAKEWAASSGTAEVEALIEIPWQGSHRIPIGEWKSTASNGFYVWSVDRSEMPVTRRGPFADFDEAKTDARQHAQSDATYDYVVTFGGDPESSDFSVEKGYRSGSGEVFLQSSYARVGKSLAAYRR